MEQDLPIWMYLTLSLVVGSLLGWAAAAMVKKSIIKRAQAEADEILQNSKDALEMQLLDEKEQLQEIEENLWGKEEKDILKTEERIEELEELVTEKKQKSDTIYNQAHQKTLHYETQIKSEEAHTKELEAGIQKLKNQLLEWNQKYIEKIAEKISLSPQDAKQESLQALISEAESRARTKLETVEDDAKESAEHKAKYLIDLVITRFARNASSERGIAPVYFEAPEQRPILIDPKGENLKALQEVTGCEIFVQDDMDLIGVAGFDPVRRELARRLLERCLKEKRPINAAFIKDKAEHLKRDLLASIKKDGDMLAKELGLQNLHPEIRQMMGSLRYRYSFTQNQYFHCGEVGWLCGLMAQELGVVDHKKARRAGMLHDLGKSMDHAQDGGHAVIGANFIEARGEAADVIHAVRAHHFDIQPEADMDYLVIAADAISGARPGARRSTIESYTQKVTELEAIARNFDGVTDCYILSGGRECRVLVNGKRVDDLAAMKLSRLIAEQIEAECNYPGQIKVVVVRETVVSETTQARM